MGRKTVFGIGLLGGLLIAAAGAGCEVLGLANALAGDEVVTVQCKGGTAEHDIGGDPDPARLTRLRVLGTLDGGAGRPTLRTIPDVSWTGTVASVDCGGDVFAAAFVLDSAW